MPQRRGRRRAREKRRVGRRKKSRKGEQKGRTGKRKVLMQQHQLRQTAEELHLNASGGSWWPK